jgi:uncharacterized protein (DUF1499 family)
MKPWIITAVCICGILLKAGCASTDERRTGMENGKLLPCPNGPKCVSTQDMDKRHHMEPISYTGSIEKARDTILSIVENMERSQVITAESDYLYIQFKSKIVGYIDDVEFYFDDNQSIIHFRSSARFGYYDWKVNRRRMEYIRDEFNRLTGGKTGG